MNVTDPIGDMLTRIRNAQQRGKSKVVSPSSRLRERVLEVLQSEGYIRGFAVTEQSNGQSELEVELKYFDGEPVIREIKRVSKPGRACMRLCRICRPFTTVWAWPSCPPPRASCRTAMHANTT
jgi:ribosomal protein S8